MSKVVVLNSGGFDSVVLMHYVKKIYGQEIISVFFNYNQRSVNEEAKHAKAVAELVDAGHIQIDLPKFLWSADSVTNHSGESKDESMYIPMRNLIFLSYAASIAEAQGADRIYAALVDTRPNVFNDCSLTFAKDFRKLIGDSSNIKFSAPFHKLEKEAVAYMARELGVEKSTYHSCNHSVVPCGKCDDCQSIQFIEEKIL